MGYILPINNEQYTQYANRTIRKDSQPFKAAPVQKVTIRARLKGKTNYEEKYEEIKQLHHDDHDKHKSEDEDHPDVEHNMEHNIAEVTGKGTLFNESI